MPACFNLTPRNGTEPEQLSEIDNKMRAHFGAPPDPKKWYENWYNIEGLGIALGHDWDKLREICPDRKPIIDWLEENYIMNAWYQGK